MGEYDLPEVIEIPVQRVASRVDVTPRHADRIYRQPAHGPAARAVERLLMIRLKRFLKARGIKPLGGPIEVSYQPHVIRLGGIAVASIRGIAWPGQLPDDLAHWVPADGCSVIVPRSLLP